MQKETRDGTLMKWQYLQRQYNMTNLYGITRTLVEKKHRGVARLFEKNDELFLHNKISEIDR